MRPATRAWRRRFRAAWPTLKRVLMVAIIVVTAVLLYRLGRDIEWSAVWQAAHRIHSGALVGAIAIVMVGYLAYASFDLLARRYTGHHLGTLKVLGVASISYALNLNLSMILGGVGVRLRLYAKLGLRRSTVVRVVVFSTVTNWIGYGWLAGALYLSSVVPMPQGWEIGSHVLQIIGGSMLVVTAAYVVLCAKSKRRTWTAWRRRLVLPSGAMAWAQAGLSALSWACMGGVIYVLFEGAVSYPEVLGLFMFSSIVALVARIPGGLGVIEAVFVAALSSRLPSHQILGVVLMYRALYGVVPLLLALAAYLVLEARLPRSSPHPRHA